MEIPYEEIIKWAGGSAVVISGVGTLIGQLILSNRAEKHRYESEAKLKITENQLSEKTETKLRIIENQLLEKTSLLNNLIEIQKSNYNFSQEKRINALDKIWRQTNDFLYSLPDSFLYVNNLPESKYADYLDREEFPENGDIRGELQNLEKEKDIVEKFREIRNNLTYERPFLGEDLYLRFHAYYTFVTRVFIHTLGGVEKNKLSHWQQDVYAKKLIKKTATEEEVVYMESNKKNSYSYALEVMEKQIVEQMSLLLSGKEATEYSMKQAEELREILTENNTVL